MQKQNSKNNDEIKAKKYIARVYRKDRRDYNGKRIIEEIGNMKILIKNL